LHTPESTGEGVGLLLLPALVLRSVPDGCCTPQSRSVGFRWAYGSGVGFDRFGAACDPRSSSQLSFL